MAKTLGRDSTEVVIAAQWDRVLGESPTTLDDNFFECGGNSFKAARLAGNLRTALGRDVPLHIVFDRPTIREQGEWFRGEGVKEGGEPAARRLMTLKHDGDRTPLVLLPGGGGSLVGLGAFASARFERPVLGLHARGLGTGETPAKTIDELSRDFADLLGESGLPRRIHLAGFCGGGVFAYHLASVLAADGWDIVSVTLIDASLTAPDISHEEIVAERLAEIAGSAGETLDTSSPLSVDTVFRRLQASELDVLEQDADAFRRRLDVFASLWRIIVEYRPAAIPMPVKLFSPPGRVDEEIAEARSLRDWCELGMPRFQQVDVEEAEVRLASHEPTLDLVEAWLCEKEESA
ncbi:alpha/beta fold hydrolase [Streptomyces yangpuensis]|uniref:alpha/beta fold hydrolase n=1 Tax=Streptomyces yangpuensis TaxID=1648182 RepID=UPI003817245C